MGTAAGLKVTGSALRSKMVDAASPIVYGYSDNLAIFASNPPVFTISNMMGGGGCGRRNREERNGRQGGARPTIPTCRRGAHRPKSPKSRMPKPGRRCR